MVSLLTVEGREEAREKEDRIKKKWKERMERKVEGEGTDGKTLRVERFGHVK